MFGDLTGGAGLSYGGSVRGQTLTPLFVLLCLPLSSLGQLNLDHSDKTILNIFNSPANCTHFCYFLLINTQLKVIKAQGQVKYT